VCAVAVLVTVAPLSTWVRAPRATQIDSLWRYGATEVAPHEGAPAISAIARVQLFL
jgi:hypothetical protein